MESKDFIRIENNNLRLKPTGARKIVNEFSNMLNKKVGYQGKESTWGYVIFLKVRDLAHYLTSRKEKLDFVKPDYIETVDFYDIRQKSSIFLTLIGRN
jgi:CRISPR-associated protein Cas1